MVTFATSADEIRALVGAGAVPHHVAEAVEGVDLLASIRLHDRSHGLDVRVHVAENA
jgi:hypothetical protein